MGKKRLEPYANAIGMKIDGFGFPTALRLNGQALEVYPVLQTHGGAANPMVYAGQNSALSNVYNAAHRQLLEYFIFR